MSETRINSNDNAITAISKLCEGNPGALNVLMQLIEKGGDIDPSMISPLAYLLLIDTFNIYGSRIWMLYKDVCGESITKTCAMLRGCQMGIIPIHVLNHAIDNRGDGLCIDDVLSELYKVLPDFKKD